MMSQIVVCGRGGLESEQHDKLLATKAWVCLSIGLSAFPMFLSGICCRIESYRCCSQSLLRKTSFTSWPLRNVRCEKTVAFGSYDYCNLSSCLLPLVYMAVLHTAGAIKMAATCQQEPLGTWPA